VTPQTPRTIIDHGGADGTVPIQNSQMFDSALIANGVTQKFLVDPGQGANQATGQVFGKSRIPFQFLAQLHERGHVDFAAKVEVGNGGEAFGDLGRHGSSH